MTVRALIGRSEPQQLQLFATPAKSRARRITGRIATAATILFVIGWFFTLRPQVLGGPAMYVRVNGVSMQPTFFTGDLAIIRKADRYALGDIVAYPVPEDDPEGVNPGTLIIHRLVGGNGTKGWITQGDNRDEADPWTPTDRDIKGMVWLHVPNAADLAGDLMTNPIALSTLMAGIVFAFILFDPKEKEKERERRKAELRDPEEADSTWR